VCFTDEKWYRPLAITGRLRSTCVTRSDSNQWRITTDYEYLASGRGILDRMTGMQLPNVDAAVYLIEGSMVSAVDARSQPACGKRSASTSSWNGSWSFLRRNRFRLSPRNRPVDEVSLAVVLFAPPPGGTSGGTAQYRAAAAPCSTHTHPGFPNARPTLTERDR
jgi:hypothetical protein